MTKKNLLITWETGSWKTYHALTQFPGSYAYIAPCKQLVYEVFQDYGNWDTEVHTGDVYLRGKKDFMWTYEWLSATNLKKYKRIIVDEFHYLADPERWLHLLDIIQTAKRQWIQVLWLTATQNLDTQLIKELWFTQLILKAWKATPKKKQVSFNKFLENARAWHKSIYFSKYTPWEEIKQEFQELLWFQDHEVDILSASNTSMERISVQNKFRAGEIPFLICTNVLAQWLNFPTTNVCIEHNDHDKREVIDQKLWRLWRPTFSDWVTEVYYCLDHKPEKHKKKKLHHFEEEYTQYSDIAHQTLWHNYPIHEVINAERLFWWYREYKYCYPTIREIFDRNIVHDQYKKAFNEAYNFLQNDREWLEMFLRWVHV